jgi:hypothetical protein
MKYWNILSLVDIGIMFWAFFFSFSLMGEIMVKGATCAKVKVFFQGLHMTHVILALVYNLKFSVSNTPFSIAF